KIELGLERVRARAMAMQESDELAALVATVFKELTRLDFTLTSCIIWIHDPETASNTLWIASAGLNKLAKPYLVQPFHHDFFRSINHAWKAKDPKWVYTLTGPEKKNFEKAFFKEIPDLPEALRKALKIPRQVVFSASFNNFGALEIVETVALTAEKFEILHRFGNVFNTSYTRFNDLKKAEAQAREAQIEAALERVRARALAMHKSEELKEVALELRNQMGLIGQKNLEVCAIHLYEEDEKYFESWFAIRPPGDEKKLYQGHSRFPKKGIKIVDEMMQRYAEGSKDYDIVNEGEKAVEWFGILRENEPEAYALISQSFGNTPIHQLKAYWAIADFSGGSLIMVTYSRADETSRNLLRRSANVFEMAYTRFLDLKKAEAQAREAKIEAALEKVRAKVMAMNSSKDLTDTSLVFGEQLRKLGIDWQFSYFWLIETDKDENTFWITWPDNKTSTTTYSLAEADESFRECIIAWQRQDKIHASFIAPEAIAEWLHTFERITADAGGAALEIMQPGNFKEGVYYYDAMIRFGSFGILTNRPINDEEKNIQSRFAVEFERAYTRFLDLQKAEAQAREARIEAALERVRSRTMAMQHSDELKDAANLLFRQVKDLGIHAWSAGYGTWLDGYKACTLYMSSEDQMQVPFIYPHTEDPVSIRFAEGAEKGLALYVEEMGGEALASHYRYMRSLPLVGEMLEEIRKAGFDVPRFQVFHVAYYSHGYLLFITYEPVPEAHTIFKRFGNVFEQTYTRFLDLQQKEEQAMRLREEKMKLEQTLAALQATQKQLIQAEKMASLGELTAGIAHEIQNPLNFVTNFSEVSNELIQEMVEEVEKGNYKEAKEIAGDVMQNLEKINFHGKRADGIVKGMLQHSRNSSGTREPTDINALADEYLRLSYHGLRAKDKSFHAKLEADFDATIEKVNVMPQDLGRVILNLINNAFYAVGEKKKQSKNGYEPTVSVRTKKQDNKIEIKVKDNGNGIPQKLMDKIFQPFFTTKPTGQGTGL
ncbi:MAG TPA: ATP-binding protein, partial [Chitinophagaceae bacterium]|nr:ATP-binding protein [Chitinophagaceae bacterium]